MKRIIKNILVLTALIPFFAAADVNVTLHKDVEALIVNGESVPMSIVEKKRFTLPNGNIQLVVRVSKLVQSESEFEKFKTDPLVISFDASDGDFIISATRTIVAKRQIKDFKQNPSFIVINNNGKDVNSTQDILPIGPGLIRDHEKELAKFNVKRANKAAQNSTAVASITDISAPSAPVILASVKAVPAIAFIEATSAGESIRHAPEPVNSNNDMVSENALILLKADFLRMNAKDKQQFLRWAVKNINY